MTMTIPHKNYATFIDRDGAEHIEDIQYYNSVTTRPVMLLFLTKSGIHIYAEDDRQVELEVRPLPQIIWARLRQNHFYKYKHNELDMERFIEWTN